MGTTHTTGAGRKTGSLLLAAASSTLALGICLSGCGAGIPPASPDPGGENAVPGLSVVTPNSDASAAANLFLAENLGYFDDEQVPVDLVLGAGATGASLLVSGDADLLLAPTTVGFPLPAQGQDISVIFSDVGGGLGAAVAVPADSPAHTIDDLAGKQVGVNGTTGLGYGFANYLSTQVVDDGGEPLKLIAFNDSTTMLNALSSGGVDAVSATTGNFAQLLASDSVRLIVDTTDDAVRKELLGSTYTIDTAYIGLPEKLKAKHESVVRFLAALSKADSYRRSHTPEEVAAVLVQGPSFQQVPVETIALSLRARDPFYTVDGGRISEEDWQATLNWFTKWDIPTIGSVNADPTFSYANVVDMSYLTEAQSDLAKAETK